MLSRIAGLLHFSGSRAEWIQLLMTIAAAVLAIVLFCKFALPPDEIASLGGDKSESPTRNILRVPQP